MKTKLILFFGILVLLLVGIFIFINNEDNQTINQEKTFYQSLQEAKEVQEKLNLPESPFIEKFLPKICEVE